MSVPPAAPGGGYVITGTVLLPLGVSIIGTPAGLPVTPWCYPPPYDTNSTGGPRIFARPTPAAAEGDPLPPLFHMLPGCTVRGLLILCVGSPMYSFQRQRKIQCMLLYRRAGGACVYTQQANKHTDIHTQSHTHTHTHTHTQTHARTLKRTFTQMRT